LIGINYPKLAQKEGWSGGALQLQIAASQLELCAAAPRKQSLNAILRCDCKRRKIVRHSDLLRYLAQTQVLKVESKLTLLDDRADTIAKQVLLPRFFRAD
jgi:hypothetical protein